MIEYVNYEAIAEARMLKDELILACQVGCVKIIINFDCMELVRAIHGVFSTTKALTICYDVCTSVKFCTLNKIVLS